MPLKHAVVTGAGTGIGGTLAQTLVENGYNVTLMGRRLEVLENREKIINAKDQTQSISCDVTARTSVDQAFTQATQHFGQVDVLVNNAGIAPTAPFHKLSSEQWSSVMAVNLDGVFHCTQQVLPAMRELRSGRIINIASTAALRGYAYVSAYTAAKHGVLGLTRALALETASLGITVNAVCPGYTDTEIIQTSIDQISAKTGRSREQALAEFTKTNPQNRLITPAEVAHTVLWLCSELSSAITGQAISVSCGEVM
ncbi:MAG: SDR family oxidoreductase [Gammaproteobacteria bacterium]|nr:SDR family oxidoreductase [Gammaproteobacteria bacterium]